jgi:hypothetical protein
MSKFIYSVVLSFILLGCYLIYDKQVNKSYFKKDKINIYILILSSTFTFCYYILLKNTIDVPISAEIPLSNNPKPPF